MKRHLRLIIGLVISLIFLYLAMRGINWGEAWTSFREADYIYLVPALLLLIAVNWTRAYRWRLLIGNEPSLGLSKVFRFVNIGYFFNNIFPAKLGEVVRTYLAGRVISGGIGQALSSLLIERLLDVLTLVVLLVILLLFIPLPAWASQAGLLFGAATVGGTIVLLVLARFGDRSVEWLWRFVGRIPVIGHPKLKEALRNLLAGFGVLTQNKLLPGILLSSALVWLGYALFNYMLMAAFHMTHLSFGAAALVLCATGFSMVLPSSPGAMGVFEWAAVQALAVFSVAESPAFAYAVGLHLFTNIALIVMGLVGLLREGVSYATIRERALATTAPDAASAEVAPTADGSNR
jgi:uncharacterized protein (TIRG00374 family)